MAYEYVDLERVYFSPCGKKTESDVRRERAVSVAFLLLLLILSIGVPLMVNIGKSLFEIQPVIY